MDLQIAVSPGELIDRLTILEIRRARIPDMDKRRGVDQAHDALARTLSAKIPSTPRLAELSNELKSINEALWQAEDDLRDHERRQVFDARFIGIARMICASNDRRSTLKRQINDLLGSPLLEEKFYGLAQKTQA